MAEGFVQVEGIEDTKLVVVEFVMVEAGIVDFVEGVEEGMMVGDTGFVVEVAEGDGFSSLNGY